MIINRYSFKGFVRIKDFIYRKMVPYSLRCQYQGFKYNKKICNDFERLFKMNFPDTIMIETVNRCNGICPFCPVNKNDDTRVYKKMDRDLFYKIIDELAVLNFEGTIGLFNNNEPLIDNRLLEFSQYAKSKLPFSWIYIFTNGTLLDEEVCRELALVLDEIVIDNYNDELCMNDNIAQLDQICRKSRYLNNKIKIHLRKQNEVLQTRGGNAPNARRIPKRRVSCYMPFTQFCIRPDGKVSLCCVDALGEYTLGDISKDSIYQVYNSEKLIALRKKFRETDFKEFSLCSSCDSFFE